MINVTFLREDNVTNNQLTTYTPIKITFHKSVGDHVYSIDVFQEYDVVGLRKVAHLDLRGRKYDIKQAYQIAVSCAIIDGFNVMPYPTMMEDIAIKPIDFKKENKDE